MPTELPTVSYKGKEGEEANVKQPVAHDNEFICSLFPLDIGHLATTFFGQSSPEDTFFRKQLSHLAWLIRLLSFQIAEA